MFTRTEDRMGLAGFGQIFRNNVRVLVGSVTSAQEALNILNLIKLFYVGARLC